MSKINIVDLSISQDRHIPFGVSPSLEKKIVSKFAHALKETVAKKIGFEYAQDINKATEKLNDLLVKCKKMEKMHSTNLEKLCYDSLFEMFNFPENTIKFECNIVDNISDKNAKLHITPQEDNEFEFENYDEVENLELEIDKRLRVLSLNIGIANVLTFHVLKRVKNDIIKLSKELYTLYYNILLLNLLISFETLIDVSDEVPNQTGGVTVILGGRNNITHIKSVGVIFPILIYESIKGFLEFFISHGLPKDKNLASYIINYTDLIKYEQYELVLGTILYSNLSNNEIDTLQLPNILKYIAKCSAETNKIFFKELLLNTKTSKKIVEKIVNNVTREINYKDFINKLTKKQKEKDIITDNEYMSIDELLNDSTDFSFEG